MKNYVASYLLSGNYTKSAFPMYDDTLKIRFMSKNNSIAKQQATQDIPEKLKRQYKNITEILEENNSP
ncbi:MAG: hypothetical protein KC550_04415, partial [Nanoarchaeota archaeon]|nr:hypothetical protein [Nanoarchaeota archaeon]